jgi:glucokinase
MHPVKRNEIEIVLPNSDWILKIKTTVKRNETEIVLIVNDWMIEMKTTNQVPQIDFEES